MTDKTLVNKIDEIRIILTDGTVMHRDKDYKWNITGQLYPRHIKLLHTINDLCRESDTGN